MMFYSAFFAALSASLVTAVLIVVSQRFHGHLSLDNLPGVQKLHTGDTPRIGGGALFFGAVIGCMFLPADAQWLGLTICVASLPAFLSGLIEDITKRVGVKTRLLATILAGLIFCMMSGYQITRVDIPGVDWLLSFGLVSLLFTAFAIGGIANSLNIIDGVNGLASGTGIIVLSGFAAVAWQVGDATVLGICLVADRGFGRLFLAELPEWPDFSG